MVQHSGLVDGAGVVVQPPGDGQVQHEVGFRHAKGGQIFGHGPQLVQALVKLGVPAPVALQGGKDIGITALDGDELEDFHRLLVSQADVGAGEHVPDALFPNLLQLVHRAHNGPCLGGEAQHGIEAVENLPVVHPNLEQLQSQSGEGAVDDGGDLRVVGDIQLAVTDDVDIRLVELPEPAPLGPFAPVDLADLEPAEGEGQLGIVKGHVLGQGDGEVKAQGQVGIALGKAVDLLLGLAAALGQQNLAGLDEGGVQRGVGIEGEGLPDDGRHAVELNLPGGEQLHKAGEGARLYLSHIDLPFFCYTQTQFEE